MKTRGPLQVPVGVTGKVFSRRIRGADLSYKDENPWIHVAKNGKKWVVVKDEFEPYDVQCVFIEKVPLVIKPEDKEVSILIQDYEPGRKLVLKTRGKMQLLLLVLGNTRIAIRREGQSYQLWKQEKGREYL